MSSGTSIVGSVKASGRKQPRPTKLGGGNASSAANASGLAMVSSVKSGGAASLSMFDDLQLGTLPVAGLLLERHPDTLLRGFALPEQEGADRCVYKLDLIWSAFNWRRG
jgi:hypothetical protein